MRDLIGIGKPKVLQAGLPSSLIAYAATSRRLVHFLATRRLFSRHDRLTPPRSPIIAAI